MNSVVEIANAALLRIGAGLILDLDEDAKAARLCRQLYGPVRDAVLRAHPWNCALCRCDLARLATAPVFGFAHQYQLPSDCLRVIGLADEAGEAPFRIEGRMLLTDVAPLKALYVRRVEEPTQFDALLADAIVARLAAELAYPIASSTSLAQSMWQLYEMKLREARGVDSQEGTPPEAVMADLWMRARL